MEQLRDIMVEEHSTPRLIAPTAMAVAKSATAQGAEAQALQKMKTPVMAKQLRARLNARTAGELELSATVLTVVELV